jgi:hypothetical protein
MEHHATLSIGVAGRCAAMDVALGHPPAARIGRPLTEGRHSACRVLLVLPGTIIGSAARSRTMRSALLLRSKWSVASNQGGDARFTGNLALASAAAVELDCVSGSPR